MRESGYLPGGLGLRRVPVEGQGGAEAGQQGVVARGGGGYDGQAGGAGALGGVEADGGAGRVDEEVGLFFCCW